MGGMANSPSVRVIEVVSDALEVPLEELPPLPHEIDPDALDRLVSEKSGSPSPRVTVWFEYAGLTVIMHSNWMVYVQPIDDKSKGAFDRVDSNS
jgi:hypothetical protein